MCVCARSKHTPAKFRRIGFRPFANGASSNALIARCFFALRCSPTNPQRQSHGEVVNINALEGLCVVLFSDQDGSLVGGGLAEVRLLEIWNQDESFDGIVRQRDFRLGSPCLIEFLRGGSDYFFFSFFCQCTEKLSAFAWFHFFFCAFCPVVFLFYCFWVAVIVHLYQGLKGQNILKSMSALICFALLKKHLNICTSPLCRFLSL